MALDFIAGFIPGHILHIKSYRAIEELLGYPFWLNLGHLILIDLHCAVDHIRGWDQCIWHFPIHSTQSNQIKKLCTLLMCVQMAFESKDTLFAKAPWMINPGIYFFFSFRFFSPLQAASSSFFCVSSHQVLVFINENILTSQQSVSLFAAPVKQGMQLNVWSWKQNISPFLSEDIFSF